MTSAADQRVSYNQRCIKCSMVPFVFLNQPKQSGRNKSARLMRISLTVKVGITLGRVGKRLVPMTPSTAESVLTESRFRCCLFVERGLCLTPGNILQRFAFVVVTGMTDCNTSLNGIQRCTGAKQITWDATVNIFSTAMHS